MAYHHHVLDRCLAVHPLGNHLSANLVVCVGVPVSLVAGTKTSDPFQVSHVVQTFFRANLFECLGCVAAPVVLAIVLYRMRVFERRVLPAIESLCVSFALADRGLLSVYRRMARALVDIGAQSDPLARELASLRLATIADEMEELGKGSVVFSGTESWRAAYQNLLLTLKVKSYLSVAWFRTADYWDDAPGRHSMQLNFDLADRGFRIERIHILPDHLWPAADRWPVPGVLARLQEQKARNILVYVAREHDLAQEPDLLCDFAIYGDRATGRQELDEKARTQRFVLSFDEDSHCQAFARWERLGLYAIALDELTG